MFEGSGPERRVDGLRPAVSSVEEGCTSLGGDIFDAVLGATILMVGVDTTKREGLIRG